MSTILVIFFINVLINLFWAQMALALLVSFQGPKKSRFSGPTPSNAPRNDVAPLKIIMYRAIKTTVTLIPVVITVVGHKSGTVAIDVHFHFECAICH
jgi:hypothetical protein